MNPQEILDVLVASGVEFATGVPDSLLSEFCRAVEDHPGIRHVTAANEGGAVSLAAGNYLATGRRALVYMQNSGLPNAINPYISMCHPTVYAMPSIWVIGWRGQPGVLDEPQHMAMGAVTSSMLETLGIPVFQLDGAQPDAADRLQIWLREKERESVAILVSAKTFDTSYISDRTLVERPLKRGDVLKLLVKGSNAEDVIFAGIGHVGRELLGLRSDDEPSREFAGDFLCTGAMGHASQFALGFALSQPRRRVWCLDGDGAFTMHMGSCNWISREPTLRFVHVLFDNGVHASVGGQAVCGERIDFGAIARAVGYMHVEKISSLSDAEGALSATRQRDGPVFLWCLVDAEAATSLPRPRLKLKERGAMFREARYD